MDKLHQVLALIKKSDMIPFNFKSKILNEPIRYHNIINSKENLHSVYKMRFNIFEIRKIKVPYGFEDLVKNLEKSNYDTINVHGLIYPDQKLVVFTDDKISEVIGIILGEDPENG